MIETTILTALIIYAAAKILRPYTHRPIRLTSNLVWGLKWRAVWEALIMLPAFVFLLTVAVGWSWYWSLLYLVGIRVLGLGVVDLRKLGSSTMHVGEVIPAMCKSCHEYGSLPEGFTQLDRIMCSRCGGEVGWPSEEKQDG